MPRYLTSLAGRSGPLHRARSRVGSPAPAESPPEASEYRYLSPAFPSRQSPQAAEPEASTPDEQPDDRDLLSGRRRPMSVNAPNRTATTTTVLKRLDAVGRADDAADRTERRAPATGLERLPSEPVVEERAARGPSIRQPEKPLDSPEPPTVAETGKRETLPDKTSTPERRWSTSDSPEPMPRFSEDSPICSPEPVETRRMPSTGPADTPPRAVAAAVSPQALPDAAPLRATPVQRNAPERSIDVRIGRIELKVNSPAPAAMPSARPPRSAPAKPPRDVLRRNYLREV